MDLIFEGVTFWLLLQVFGLPVFLPLLVGLVTTRITHPRTQAILLLFLSVVTALLTNMLNAFQSGQASFNLGLALVTAFTTFIFGVGVHVGFLRPTGATGAVLDHGRTRVVEDTSSVVRDDPGLPPGHHLV